MIRRPPRSTLSSSSAASDVYKRQLLMRLDSGWGKQQIPHGLKAVRDDNSEIAKKGHPNGQPFVAPLAPKTAIRFDPLHWRAGHSYPTGTVLTCSAPVRELPRPAWPPHDWLAEQCRAVPQWS